MAITPRCHPERKHAGKGLCPNCYAKAKGYNTYKYRISRDGEDHLRYARNANRKRNTGVTEEQYNLVLNFQKGLCAICAASVSSGFRKLSADHDHRTNEFRGILCSNCNAALGLLGDDIEGIWRALTYLLAPPAKTCYNV